MISPHHSHPSNGVEPSNFNGGRSTPELEKALSKLVFVPGMWKSGDLYRAKVDAVYREMEKARNRSAGAAK